MYIMAVYLDESVQSYLDWLKNIKMAPYHTFRAYQVDLTQFLKYFLNHDRNEIPSKDDFLAYINEIEGKYTYSTYRRKVTALRNFISYLIESGIDVPDPFVSISLPVPDVDYDLPIKYEEVLNLIDSMPEDEITAVRDKIILSLISKSGLTVKQLLDLKVKDINLASNQIILSKSQLTFIDDKTNKLLDRFISKFKLKYELTLDDHLIVNNSKIPLSTRTINLIVDRTGKKMRFHSRLSPTILRRLFAKSLGNRKLSKDTLEMILGRKSRLTLGHNKIAPEETNDEENTIDTNLAN